MWYTYNHLCHQYPNIFKCYPAWGYFPKTTLTCSRGFEPVTFHLQGDPVYLLNYSRWNRQIKQPLTLCTFHSITDCRRRRDLSWALRDSLPLLRLVFIRFIVFSSSFLRPVEHGPLSDPQSGQEHVFAHLFPFAVHHQVIAQRNRSPRLRSRRSRSFHGVAVHLSRHVLFSLSPVHVLPELLKHPLPGLLVDFITQPVRCLFAGVRGAPRSHSSWLLCHQLAVFFAFAGVRLALHPQLFLLVLLPLWWIRVFGFGFLAVSPCSVRMSVPILSSCRKECWKTTNENDNWINYWEQHSEINRLQISKTKYLMLTGISTQRTCVWWRKLGNHLRLCCHHRMGPFFGRSIRFPASITDLQIVWIKHTHLVKTCQWYGDVSLLRQKRTNGSGSPLTRCCHIIPKANLIMLQQESSSCQNKKLVIMWNVSIYKMIIHYNTEHFTLLDNSTLHSQVIKCFMSIMLYSYKCVEVHQVILCSSPRWWKAEGKFHSPQSNSGDSQQHLISSLSLSTKSSGAVTSKSD